ncbi:Protein INVOLVED IN DE NOVO 2 [Clarias magur]|uniref:Protein INVOLVED IN DE NOVO 2 n=1 Tax=Clarias magur TaxID=1594786 RepID=A0A8J4X5I8_CLAMG|nr:Protein INVOLVED IN DE NOVO 2 [Clarias magur]
MRHGGVYMWKGIWEAIPESRARGGRAGLMTSMTFSQSTDACTRTESTRAPSPLLPGF